MSLNFSSQNLQGRSFKGKNLTGADFSYADIRGCDFTNAILKNANFNQTKAGLLNKWIVLLIAILFLLSGISGATSGLASVILSILFESKYIQKHTILPGVISCIAIFIFFAIIIRRGFGLDLAIATGGFTGILAGLILPVLWIQLGYHGLEVANEIGWRLAGVAAWLLAGFILGIFSLTAAWNIYQGSGAFLWIAWIIGLALSSYASWILKNSSKSWLQFWILTITWAGLFALMRYYVSWQSLIGNPKFVLIQKMAIAFTTIGGTSFRKADLTDAVWFLRT
jgi:Pentapeptide repeats (8 copies)